MNAISVMKLGHFEGSLWTLKTTKIILNSSEKFGEYEYITYSWGNR